MFDSWTAMERSSKTFFILDRVGKVWKTCWVFISVFVSVWEIFASLPVVKITQEVKRISTN